MLGLLLQFLTAKEAKCAKEDLGWVIGLMAPRGRIAKDALC